MRAPLLLALTFGVTACLPPPSPPPPPCPVTVSPTELDFGEVEATTFTRRNLVFTNSSSSVMHFTLAEPVDFPFQPVRGERFSVDAASEQVVTIQVRPSDGLLHLDTFVVRSADERCELTVPLRALGSGLLVVEPDPLTFQVNPGQTQTKDLRLVNSRREPITVQAALRPSPNPFMLTAPEGLTLPALGEIPLLVTANPTTWSQARVQLVLTTERETVTADVTQRPSSPRLEVTPASFTIPTVRFDPSSQPKGYVERVIRVRNAGTSGDPAAPPLRFDSVAILSGDPRELVRSAPDQGTPLAEGESLELGVRIVPIGAPGPRSYLLSVLAANTPPLQPALVQIDANAEVLPSCEFQIDPLNALVLSDALDGGVEGSVSFTNTSANRCIVDNPRLSEAPQFAIVAGAQSQVEVPAQGVHRFTIAGPKPLDAGVVGAFGYHVLQPNHDVRWIELRASP